MGSNTIQLRNSFLLLFFGDEFHQSIAYFFYQKSICRCDLCNNIPALFCQYYDRSPNILSHYWPIQDVINYDSVGSNQSWNLGFKSGIVSEESIKELSRWMSVIALNYINVIIIFLLKQLHFKWIFLNCWWNKNNVPIA